MTGKSTKILQDFVARTIKSPRVHNATISAANYLSGKAQLPIYNLRQTATAKYEAVMQQLYSPPTSQDEKAVSVQAARPLPENVVNWWRWYQELTGMTDVESSKQQVQAVQNRLFQCQEERRTLNIQAFEVAESLKEIYGEMSRMGRDDSRYVALATRENKKLQEQSRIMKQTKLLDIEEREQFTKMVTAVKEYHDNQTLNMQKYKYLSVLVSAGLAIASLCTSMIYNNRRLADVRNVIASGQDHSEQYLEQHFSSLQQQLSNMTSILTASNTIPVGHASTAPIPNVGQVFSDSAIQGLSYSGAQLSNLATRLGTAVKNLVEIKVEKVVPQEQVNQRNLRDEVSKQHRTETKRIPPVKNTQTEILRESEPVLQSSPESGSKTGYLGICVSIIVVLILGRVFC